MTQLTFIRGRKMSTLIVLGLLAVVLGASKQDNGFVVPDDQSLSVEGYMQQGLPDPAVSWSIAEYAPALKQLAKLPGSQLPRLHSSRSGLVFQRLLITQLEVPDLALQGDGATLADLYGLNREDNLLFDRELLAIRASRLKAIIAKAPSEDDIHAAERDVSALYERAESQEERSRRAETLQVYSQLLRQSSEMLREGALGILYLLSLEGVSPAARAEAVAELNTLIPLFRGRLLKTDLEAIAQELRGLGRLDRNASIANELGDLAARVEASAAG